MIPVEDLDKLRKLRFKSGNDVLDQQNPLGPAEQSRFVNCDCTEFKELESKDGKKLVEKSKTSGDVDVNSLYNLYLVQNANNTLPTVFVITPTYFRY